MVYYDISLEELEEEVEESLSSDWNKAICWNCEHPFSLTDENLSGDDPICPSCGQNQNEIGEI